MGCLDDDDPETCLCTANVEAACAYDGSDAWYEESFGGSVHHTNSAGAKAVRRNIVAGGCPNHEWYPVNLNCAGGQSYSAHGLSPKPRPPRARLFTPPFCEQVSIPAYPFFNGASYEDALAAATDLSEQGGDVGLTLNGVAIYTAWAGSYDYDGDGDIDEDDVMSETSNAVTAEGETFDRCGGHSSGSSAGFQYHYHIPPTCLLAQLGQYIGQHSPQVGWMYDGFPVYGPFGPDGVQMIKCGQTGAHEVYCLDACKCALPCPLLISSYLGVLSPDLCAHLSGYYSDDESIDVFKYRYYMSGNATDQTSLRASPLPTSDPVESSFFPFTPLCSLGCKPSGANQNNWEGGVASWLPVCDTSASVAAYTRTSVDLDSSTPSDEGGLRSGVVDTYIAGANSINNASGTVAPIYSTSFPNVLLFQPDDMYQAYSDHWHSPADPGFDLPTTSYEATYQIDRIGLEGATFTRAYSASGLCAPSRVALLTGRYASRGEHAIGKTASNYADTHTRVTVPYSKLTGADSSHNLAAGLGSVGFRTGAFGKWHIAAEADLNAMGCEYSSTEYECDYAIAQQVVQQAGFDVAEAIFIANLNNCGTTCSDSFSHNMEWLTFEAITFMADALDASQPFFAYVNPRCRTAPTPQTRSRPGTTVRTSARLLQRARSPTTGLRPATAP